MTELNTLPAPKTDTLKRPPLELVVCQVRHEPLSAISDARQVLALQTAFGNGFSKLEPQSGTQIQFPPVAGPPQIAQSSGWRLTTVDGSWIATLNADSFALECTQYTSWSEFKALLNALIEAMAATFEPKLVQRVGVRYVDRIWREGSTRPAEWRGFLNPGVLGLANNEALSDAVTVSQTFNELSVGPYRATVRGSIASDNTPNKYSMVLDTDCYDERSASFEIDRLRGVVDDLHELSLQLFQEVISDKLYEELRG